MPKGIAGIYGQALQRGEEGDGGAEGEGDDWIKEIDSKVAEPKLPR